MTHIRILHRDTAGKVFDGSVDFSLEDFAGQVPASGDMILNPGVPVGKKRDDLRNRESGPWSGAYSIRATTRTMYP